MGMRVELRRWIVMAWVLAAGDLFIAITVDMSGQVFGLSAFLTLAAYLTIAAALLLVLVRLVVAQRRYWPLLLVWALWHMAMLPAW